MVFACVCYSWLFLEVAIRGQKAIPISWPFVAIRGHSLLFVAIIVVAIRGYSWLFQFRS